MSTRATAEWTQRPERGSLPVVRFMAWLSVAIGRGASRVLLRFIVLYFFVTGGPARRHSAEFLQRALGRRPSLMETYGLFFSFGSTIHDRVYFLRGRFDLFDIEVRAGISSTAKARSSWAATSAASRCFAPVDAASAIGASS